MITFGQLVEYAKKRAANAVTTFGDELLRFMVDSAVQEVWNARAWPFHLAESSIATVAPYITGTVTATNGSTAITLATGTWSTAWPTPARIYIQNETTDYLITAFGSTTAATLDKAFVGSSASGLTYELSFPAYELPSDFLTLEKPTSGWWWGNMRPITYDEWLGLRIDGPFTGLTDRYTIIQGDGYTNPKIYLYPAPQEAYLVRFPYRKANPEGRLYTTGTATATNGSKTITGASTSWTKLGYSIGNQILEFPSSTTGRGVRGTIDSTASITGTGAFVLVNWPGVTQTTQVYRLSNQIKMPDSLLPALYATVDVKAAEGMDNLNKASYYRGVMNSELSRAANAIQPIRDSLCKADAYSGNLDFPVPRLATDANGDDFLLRW